MSITKSKDNKWSRDVRNRENNRCQIGLSGCLIEATDAMHILPRGFMKLRHDIDNGLAGCRFCHNQCDEQKVDFIELVERIASEQFERLREKVLKYYNRRIG